jgi:hypothetical protein
VQAKFFDVVCFVVKKFDRISPGQSKQAYLRITHFIDIDHADVSGQGALRAD